MKATKIIITAALGILACVAGRAAVIYSQKLVDENALAYSKSFVLDLGASPLKGSNIDSISFQATYFAASPTSVSVTDGLASTGTITISSYPALAGTKAINTLTVKSTSTLASLSLVYFEINGIRLVKDDLWSVGSSSGATANSICSAINAYGPLSSVVSCSSTTTEGVATITALSNGSAQNNYTLVSSTPAALTAGAAKFFGGQNDAWITIAGKTLTQGTEWTAATSSAATADSLTSGIKANTTLNSILTVSTNVASPGVISVTSKGVGTDTRYYWFASSQTALVLTHSGLIGGTATGISTSNNSISYTGHTFTRALPVLFSVVTGTAPGQLVNGTTYYAVPVTSSSFKVAASSTAAIAGTAVSIATQTATGGGSFTFTPLAYSGTPSFKWESSNDDTNWVDVNVSSVTMSTGAAGTMLWDLGTVNYRYIRLNVLGPTTGGIYLNVTGHGKSKY